MCSVSKDNVENLIDRFLSGSTLKHKDATILENKLQKTSGDLATIVTLLGYYETRHLGSKSIRLRRQELIRWIFQNVPDHPFLSRSLPIVVQSHDPKFHAEIVGLWNDNLNVPQPSAQLLVNAANHLLRHDPAQARRLLIEAEGIDCTNPDIKRVLTRLESLMST